MTLVLPDPFPCYCANERGILLGLPTVVYRLHMDDGFTSSGLSGKPNSQSPGMDTVLFLSIHRVSGLGGSQDPM